ncbi:fungal pheromone STE3G-protein-coupled receptor [Schizopora paradoxa]|uniref:Fungal pheromone STE3G-protein-coupled receptor n=1 Tax=Schizopora paradoxa TaxID=27342 RepID=A0A0H2RCF9_9AGAM|nr:fungal pheromone STE3G-protein-coupled receptor [Schizopora paradoxa]
MYALTPYPITPIGNFIGTVLALLPLLSQIRKLSPAVWGYAVWIAIYDFITFVDTIIWHNNVNIVVPVWCDITSKLLTGVPIGTRACAFIICLDLFRMTRLRGTIDKSKAQKRRETIYKLLLTIGLPILIMALYIIVQPIRFGISEEQGCGPGIYSYVGYIIWYAPPIALSFGCAILAPLTLRTFLRHRREMHEFLTNDQDYTYNRYTRLMLIACLDTIFNLPVIIVGVAVDILQGGSSPLNYPYVSWKNVHYEAFPGLNLSSIETIPASEWSTDKWNVFSTKWNEWVYVFHAVIFFALFGTTPEMRRYYQRAFWFIPEHCGYKKRSVSELETISDVVFSSNGAQPTSTRTANE